MPASVSGSTSSSVASPSSVAVTVTAVAPAPSAMAAGSADRVTVRDSSSRSANATGSRESPAAAGAMPAPPPLQCPSTTSASSPSAKPSSTILSSATRPVLQPLPGLSCRLAARNSTSSPPATLPAARRRPQPVYFPASGGFRRVSLARTLPASSRTASGFRDPKSTTSVRRADTATVCVPSRLPAASRGRFAMSAFAV